MHVELPRAVPLVFYLDENLRPVRLAGAAPHLSGEYVGDPEEVRGPWWSLLSVTATVVVIHHTHTHIPPFRKKSSRDAGPPPQRLRAREKGPIIERQTNVPKFVCRPTP